MVDGSCDGLIRSYPQGVLDRREAGNGYVRVMIVVGDAGTWDERGQDIEKSEHRLLDRMRICGEGLANHSSARVDPSKCEHIDNSSIRGTSPIIRLLREEIGVILFTINV